MPQPTVITPYTADRSRYDELLAADGEVRAHWRPLIERLDASNADAIRRGVELARRLIVENGVTYNVYADPQGRDRPWQLDTLPLILPAEEWQSLAAGVAQRASLLDSLLADLYGPQRLLAEGIVPPEIVFGHPNFLWPCRGLSPVGGRWLHVYAADLARAPNGQWWVLGDRTQTPSGPGYALENRRIVSRVFPQVLDDLRVRSPGGFFATLREQLLSQVEDDESPLAVVLTPGPFNETYFEHAYLARQLGLALVEGADLTVRGDTLYLKTFAGLRRVHAVLRRLDDDFCDPAELRSDSALGVPGLLQVVRARRVVLANALGSGVLESASWLGFLPPIAEWFSSEALALPSVATWWCGERPALEHVIANLDQLVIKPTFPNQRFEPVFGRTLDRKAKAALIARLRSRPYAYVAQERVALSQSPAWGPNGVTARALAIRVYAVATPNGYEVMPGGLARIAQDASADIVSNQRGGGSKDIWVIAADSSDDGDAPVPAQRRRGRNEDLPSRLVENLFWMGRYAGRCEDKARLARATLALDTRSESWKHAINSCAHFGVLAEKSDLATSLFDMTNAAGLAADLRRLEWSATQARSRLSAEHWRAIGVLQRQYHESASSRSDAREALDRLVLALSGLAGFALDDMTQDDGWRMLILGRRLERVQFLSALFGLRLAVAAAPSRGELEWWLDITGSTVAYRTRNLERARLASVLHLLIRDGQNPRSLGFQCAEIRAILNHLRLSGGIAPDECFDPAVADIDDADLGVLEGAGYTAIAARQAFAQRLLALAGAATDLSDRLSMRHFSHTEGDLQVVAA
ncbi:MAG TPA: circularly permuted type 2 ATP-grasp protein [Povalibacter sp.]|uniref:circularly permuted type 2 ATP-grasp protein n=1 Tax=Povalibacter sp. TaxID=1962978 RepID=UPI002B5F4D25|nr:circularly permuted type 2 ATP-grasp protein [Povalibacter sp.]HMN44339.1 circularly permuted type 2 ATP-grasp protein [Povalibacter sp.]